MRISARRSGRWPDRLAEDGAQNGGEPCQQQPHVVASGDEEGIDGIAVAALEVVALKEAVGFRVSDN